MSRTVELRVAGQNYRVVSSATTAELEHLASVVNGKLGEIAPQGRGNGAQGLLLVALALAHDVEEAREEHQAFQARTRDLLTNVLGRIDSALAAGEIAASDGPEGGAGPCAQNAGEPPPGEERFT